MSGPLVPERVREVMAALPRDAFLPEVERRHAGQDRPLPIGHGQTNSQPTTVAHLLALLDAAPGHRVLDVGCGSGWTTALLTRLTGPDGRVVGVEVVADLTAAARANLAASLAPGEADRARVEQARSGVLGLPDEAPWDRVLVSAEARELPRQLAGQLAVGGVMVVPVAGRLLAVGRRGLDADDLDVREHGRYAFVPLVDG